MDRDEDSALLTELSFHVDVDQNTVKNEMIIQEVSDMINKPITEQPAQPIPEGTKQEESKEESTQEDTKQVASSTDDAQTASCKTGSTFHSKILTLLKNNIKLLLVAFSAVFIQFLLYHVPSVNKFIDGISQDNSSKIKFLVTFVLIFMIQKELLKLLQP